MTRAQDIILNSKQRKDKTTSSCHTLWKEWMSVFQECWPISKSFNQVRKQVRPKSKSSKMQVSKMSTVQTRKRRFSIASKIYATLCKRPSSQCLSKLQREQWPTVAQMKFSWLGVLAAIWGFKRWCRSWPKSEGVQFVPWTIDTVSTTEQWLHTLVFSNSLPKVNKECPWQNAPSRKDSGQMKSLSSGEMIDTISS